MKVLVVSQYFPPEKGFICASVPFELAARGHDVTVVTGFPNYPEGRLFAGYRQRFGYFERQGKVAVWRTPLWISHSRNPLGRVMNYLSFGLSVFSASRSARHADIVYVYATQMTPAIAPLWWRYVLRVPFVLHIQDLWPESITGSGLIGSRLGRITGALLRPWLRSTYRAAAGVIGIAPTMTRTLVSRGVSHARAHTVVNWAPAAARPSLDEAHAGTPALRLMYAGNLGEMQDLPTLFRALSLARDIEGLSLDVFGTGTAHASSMALVAELGLESVVTFHGRVTVEELSEYAAGVDFQLVTLKNLPVFRMTIPSKFQASMAMGVPVIATVPGDLAEIVRRHRVGIAVDPSDPHALADALRRASQVSGEERRGLRVSARRLYESQMSMEAGIGAIEEILIAASRPQEPRRKIR